MAIKHAKVSEVPDTADETLIRPSDWNADHIVDEIRLVPKASSTGAEGTIFYDSDDDHVYVGVE